MIEYQLLILFADLLIIAGLYWVVSEVLQIRHTAPFIRTHESVVDEVVQIFGELPKGSVVYDPGCGDARTLAILAKRNPNARCISIELRRFPYLLGRWRLWRDPVPNLELRRGNMYNVDFRDATHIYTYLYPKVMASLEPKFKKELKPGTILISLDFTLKTMRPTRNLQLASFTEESLGKTLSVYQF